MRCFFFLRIRRPPRSTRTDTLFPYTTLFRSSTVSLADSPAFSGLLDDLRDLFDLVVLDTPPVLPVDDSRVISAQADGVVLLVRWRRTTATAAELALRQLDEVGARVLGASLTQVDLIAPTRAGRSEGRPVGKEGV